MFDPKCLELACHFLGDFPEIAALRNQLAQHIQDEIESWLEDEAQKRREALGPEEGA